MDVSFSVVDSCKKVINKKCIVNQDPRDFSNFARGFPIFLTHKELFKNYEELVPNKVITVYCEMELYESSIENEATLADKIINIEESYESLLKNGLYSDLTILTSDNQEIKAHKGVLVSRCPSFAAVFESNKENEYTSLIKILEFDKTTIFEFLRYVYCGKIENLTELAASLIQIANKVNILRLLKGFI
ncbi:unnamed protein product [Diamesa serratosioi]